MIIQDVEFTLPDGRVELFEGVANRQVIPINDAIAIFDMTSALKTPLGVQVLIPGITVRYKKQIAVSSQIDAESGMVPVRNEFDDAAN